MHSIPFGLHRGRPLPDIPSDYLRWLLTIKLSSGLRAAVGEELDRRGVEVPPLPEKESPKCSRHPTVELRFSWQTDRRGGRRIRATCSTCRRFVYFAPQLPAFVELADAAEPAGVSG